MIISCNIQVSIPDEITPDDTGMSSDELDKRDAFYKSINFVKSMKLRGGEYTFEMLRDELLRLNKKATLKTLYYVNLLETITP